NLIVRTIVPYIHQEDVFKGSAASVEEDIDGIPVEVTPGPRPPGRVQDGLGDIVQSFSFLRKNLSADGSWALGRSFFIPAPPTIYRGARNGGPVLPVFCCS